MEYITISDNKKKENLLDSMVRVLPAGNMSKRQWHNSIYSYLIKMPVSWVLMKGFNLEYSEAELYKNKYGKWRHRSGKGNDIDSHNILGMAYAWRFKSHFPESKFDLSDSPDFYGFIKNKYICGDIGQCTNVALFDGLRGLGIHSLWISVLDYNTQVILEFNYNVSRLLTINMQKLLFPDHFNKDEVIKDIFWCKDCKMWTITPESREQFIL